MFSIREADELLWVGQAVQQVDVPGALDKLRVALGGAEYAKEETSTAARNALFELRIASYFVQAGFLVDITTEADAALAPHALHHRHQGTGPMAGLYGSGDGGNRCARGFAHPVEGQILPDGG